MADASCTDCGARIEGDAESCPACGAPRSSGGQEADAPIHTPQSPDWYRDRQKPGVSRYWDGQAWTEERAFAPAGWYDDPREPGGQRYWDGQDWTEERVSATAEAGGDPMAPTHVVEPAGVGREEAASPPSRRSRRRPVAVALLVLALAAGAGIGAYFVGRSTGEDLDAARAAGAAAGQREGAAKGAEEGYAKGFAQGQKKGYRETYENAYREAYRTALEDAGYTPANNEPASIPQPQP